MSTMSSSTQETQESTSVIYGAASLLYSTRRIHNPHVDFVTGTAGRQPVVRYEAYDRDQQRIVGQVIPAPTLEAANEIVQLAVDEETISPVSFRAAAARISATAQAARAREDIERQSRQFMEGQMLGVGPRPGIEIPSPASDPMAGSARGRLRAAAPPVPESELESDIESFLSSTSEHPSVATTAAVTEEDRSSLLAERNEHAVKGRSLIDLQKQRQAQRDFFNPSAFDLRSGKFQPINIRTAQTGDSRIPKTRYVNVKYDRPREGWEVLSTYALAPVSRSSFSVATDAKSVFTPLFP